VAVLILTTCLFGSITIVQYYFGTVLTKSKSLVADCNSMAADTLSYFLNIFAELAPPAWKRKLQLVIPILSLTVLATLTVLAFQDSLGALLKPCDIDESNPDADDSCLGPNPWIVWAFGLGGLIFDLISIWAFCKNKNQKSEGKLPVNMLAAFMHVGADMIRSLTTTVEGFFLISKVWGADQGKTVDAWSCMIITVVIFIGIVFGVYEVIVDIVTYCRTGE